jgi:luciferase family oxidoreductase group 1
VRLSVLDQSVATVGSGHAEAIRRTIALARHCEGLGYERFWLSEHHSHGTIVGTAPEILIAAIAATTERIRVGAAGIMLPHYSALKVAEQFRVLDAIAPGRIDLGLGRAPGSDGLTAFALHPQADTRHERFPSDVHDILDWTSGKPLREGHPFAAVKAYPQGETVPEVWILGSSLYGAQVAAHFGLPYAFAWFFSDGDGGEQAMALYRELYKPSVRHPEPHSALCVFALAAPTQEEADYHYQSRARAQLLRRRNIHGPIESPDAAAAYPYTDEERAFMESRRKRSFVGTPGEVAAGIEALARRVQADEMAVVTWTYDEDVRKRSYALLAEAFGLRHNAPKGGPIHATR